MSRAQSVFTDLDFVKTHELCVCPSASALGDGSGYAFLSCPAPGLWLRGSIPFRSGSVDTLQDPAASCGLRVHTQNALLPITRVHVWGCVVTGVGEGELRFRRVSDRGTCSL